MTTKIPRRAVLAGIATAPALAAPALGMGDPDPIFAAITEYNAAIFTRNIAMRRCHNFSEDSPLNHLPADAPECILAEQVHDAALGRVFEALDKLLATSPTTIAGMAALLDRLAVSAYVEVDDDSEPLIRMALDESPTYLAQLASALRRAVS
jgi:hypothetical protein